MTVPYGCGARSRIAVHVVMVILAITQVRLTMVGTRAAPGMKVFEVMRKRV